MKNYMEEEYREWIIDENHPCIMAQTIFSQDTFTLKKYGALGKPDFDVKLLQDLNSYIEDYDFDSNDFQTFIAVFPEDAASSEIDFEQELWRRLIELSKLDNSKWDSAVSRNPEDNHFSFSLGGKAFYIVGMHPNSSRIARKSPYPSIAFNLHHQFERLREMGVYENVRDRIRQRDRDLQGFINPMLEDFGNKSEARQYSGRISGKDWKCPFSKDLD